MKDLETLKQQFVDPPAEFSPIPFWFWNDELSQEEILRQIHDFHAKEVAGFVIHPRMGLSRDIPYLSETYFELVETAVAEADRLGMKVILYDEGMYPSGSACGMVVKSNPDYASRGLQLREFPCKGADGILRVPISLSPGETLVSAQAVRKLSDQDIAAESVLVLGVEQDSVQFAPPDPGDWSVLLFIDTASKGTIRGVHSGQDDGEPEAPLAADLLNPEAMQAFITLTHEQYYSKLSRYFGTTIFAMFTDEPDLLGRRHTRGLKPWTRELMNELLANGGREQDLPALWFNAGEATERIRDLFKTTVRNRLARTYYKPLADWCEAHGIALTGHPASSDDIGLLEDFQIPGQDVVWRYIAPEDDKSLTGVHSTMGKCSSDAARHRSRRRNLNEAFGVCGIEGGWSLTADNMKWYLDWLFVRGVNLICPHAFYYSIREERRDERPPDVGPNNIWWPEYAQFSRYIKRMSWLMTDSKNGADVAVLAGAAYLPWKIVKPLYESQIEFNYLEESLLCHSCQCKDGALEIADYRYKAVLIEESHRLSAESWIKLEAFQEQGGLIIELSGDQGNTPNIGQLRIDQAEKIPAALAHTLAVEFVLEPASESIRISRVNKDGIWFYTIVNEGENAYEGALLTKHLGHAEIWHPWTGECEAARVERTGEEQRIKLHVARRECVVIAVDKSENSSAFVPNPGTATMIEDLSADWQVLDGPGAGKITTLASWTEWAGMEHFSGTVMYEKSFELKDPSRWDGFELDLGMAHEMVRLWVNGREAGVRMWSPYTFDIGRELQPGTNILRVSVTNSLANRYDGKSFPSGLLGPVRLHGVKS